MPRQVFRFDPPERVVVGTVGEPGQRTFFLQARAGNRITSVVLEKAQVKVLAERLGELLDEVVRRSAGAAAVPAVAPAELDDRGPLELPVTEEFRVGTLTLAWEPVDSRVVIEAFATPPQDDDAAEPDEADAAEPDEADTPDDTPEDTADRDVFVVRMTGATARAFAARALSVVSAGRPPCPLCAQPLDPEGHICPRQNGYRRRG